MPAAHQGGPGNLSKRRKGVRRGRGAHAHRPRLRGQPATRRSPSRKATISPPSTPRAPRTSAPLPPKHRGKLLLVIGEGRSRRRPIHPQLRANPPAPRSIRAHQQPQRLRRRRHRHVRPLAGGLDWHGSGILPLPQGAHTSKATASAVRAWKLSEKLDKCCRLKGCCTNRLIIEPTKLNRLRPAGLSQRPFLYQPGSTALELEEKQKRQGLKARSIAAHGLGRAFSPCR